MKTTNTILGLLVGGIFFLGSNNILAQERPQRGGNQKPPTFKQLLKDLDKNEDGKLSKKEVKGPLKDDFDQIDTNEDGFISEKEFEERPKPKRGKGRN